MFDISEHVLANAAIPVIASAVMNCTIRTRERILGRANRQTETHHNSDRTSMMRLIERLARLLDDENEILVSRCQQSAQRVLRSAPAKEFWVEQIDKL